MLRDIVIAHQFGASEIVGAYNAAMTIPNTFILFMLTGIKDAFVPSYLKYESQKKGFAHLTNIVKGTFIIGLVISILGVLFSPFLISTFFPTFDSERKLAIYTSSVYFLSIFLVGVNAVYEGYFDANKKYSFSTFSQTVVVLSTIGSILFLSHFMGGYSIAFGYLMGTIISFLIKLFYFKPQQFIYWKQKINVDEVKRFYYVFIPVGLTTMVGQINLNISNFYAAQFGAEAISYVNYAFRLVSIPQAFFGVTVATIIFPLISKAKSEDNWSGFKAGIEKGLSIMFLFVSPSVAGLALLMEEIVQIVYERGAFDSVATAATSEVGYYYLGTVLFFSIQVIIAKGFYSLEKGNLILRIGIVSIFLNIIFGFLFTRWIGYKGLGLSSSVIGFIYTTLAFILLNRYIGGFSIKWIGKEFGKIICATIVMVVCLIIMVDFFKNWNVYLFVSINATIGAIIYFMMAWLLKIQSFLYIIEKNRLK